MTQNQIAYLNYQENARHNLENEKIGQEGNKINWDKNSVAREQIKAQERASKRSTAASVATSIIGSIAGMFSLKKNL